jgi:SAM-dependent methyltransferase
MARTPVWLHSLYQAMTGLRWRNRGADLVKRWQHLSNQGQAQARSVAGSPEAAPNPIRDYFDRHSEGPGIQKWLHYFEIYHRHLAKFVGRSPVVVEVGIYSGGSLPMWKHYFGPGCHVHGIDIDPECIAYNGADTTVHIGDQADRAMWRRFREAVPQVDILIDDGAHTPEEQVVTLEEMLPHLRPGGVYICEDVHGARNHFAEFADALCNGLNAGEIEPGAGVDTIAQTPYQRALHSVHIYPLLVLIEKREYSEPLFSAPLRGTQWLPWK